MNSMKNEFLKLLLFAFAVFPFFSLRAEKFTVNLEDFDALEIEVSGSIDWKSGQSGCSVECPASLFEVLEFRQEGRKLAIRWKKKGKWDWNYGNNKVQIHLQSQSLKKAAISGSADLKFLSPDKVQDFDLRIAGSGDFSGPLDCAGSLSMELSGSGDLFPSGKCQNLNLRISGSGDFKGAGLHAEKAKIAIAGSGDATVFASEELEVVVSGSGDIRYAGKPKKVKKVVSGSGEISPMK